MKTTLPKILRSVASLFAAILLFSGVARAQKVGFIASDEIRKYFPEAKQADQRLKSIVEEWKRELQAIDENISILKDDINKNRLVWDDDERRDKEGQLRELEKRRRTYAKEKFSPGGEYDKVVKTLMEKIEEKIYAATQEVAAEEGYDLVLDKSVQPLPYTNYKYDLTVKVLRKLGVDTEELEKELREKIEKDPRNKRRKSRYAPSRRRRSRRRKRPSASSTPSGTENPIENKTEEPPKPPKEIKRESVIHK